MSGSSVKKVLKWSGFVVAGLAGIVIVAAVYVYVASEHALNREHAFVAESVAPMSVDPAARAIEVAEGKRERLPRNATLDMLYVNGDVDNTSGAAGESAGLIHELKSVRQIIDDTIASFWREIDRLAALRPNTLTPQAPLPR